MSGVKVDRASVVYLWSNLEHLKTLLNCHKDASIFLSNKNRAYLQHLSRTRTVPIFSTKTCVNTDNGHVQNFKFQILISCDMAFNEDVIPIFLFYKE